MNNRNGKSRIVIILFWIIVVLNILWFGSMLIKNNSDSEEKENQPAGVKDSNELDCFYYNQLSPEDQHAYEILLEGLKNREESIILNHCASASTEAVWDAVLKEHPEIFWTNAYQYLEYKEEPYCDVRPDYCYTRDEIKDRQSQLEDLVSDFLKGASGCDTDYDKIRYTYEYIINQTDYNLQAENNQHIDSVLIGKESVCAGYARTTKYLLNQLGIPCMYLNGEAKKENENPESHAWNIVLCENDTYFVDTTWGDPVYLNPDGSEAEQGDNINYDYLCCNEEFLLQTHAPNPNYTYPSCTKENIEQ